MKHAIFFALLLILAGTGFLLYLASRHRLASGQAGVAYVEASDGTIRLAESTRAQERTVVPGKLPTETGEQWLTRFTLTERSGKKMGSEELSGEPYVASFFFSMCPSVCVRQNEHIGILQQKFKDKPIRFLSISVDPEVDRPEVLSQYAQRFGADKDQWLFFTGDMDYITRVGGEIFSLGVHPKGHPEKFALVDASGKVFGLYTWTDPNQWQALQADIEKMLSVPKSTDLP